MPQIQWYPGHMARARREVEENVRQVDFVIELVDARIPESSRNPIMDEVIGDKPRVLALNKADLADPSATDRWLNYYRNMGENVIAIDAQHNRGIRQLEQLIEELMEPYFERQAARGVRRRPIRLMILGIPNVGKSTLINRFVGKNQAIVGDRPGVTRAQRWLKIGERFELLDTPGILWPKFEDRAVALRLGISGAIKDTLLHMDDLALYLLEHLKNHYPLALPERYKVTEEDQDTMTTVDLLLAITQKMGFQEDYDRASERLIHDFRNKRLGRISIDLVEELED